jgi:hypothetical protein
MGASGLDTGIVPRLLSNSSDQGMRCGLRRSQTVSFGPAVRRGRVTYYRRSSAKAEASESRRKTSPHSIEDREKKFPGGRFSPSARNERSTAVAGRLDWNTPRRPSTSAFFFQERRRNASAFRSVEEQPPRRTDRRIEGWKRRRSLCKVRRSGSDRRTLGSESDVDEDRVRAVASTPNTEALPRLPPPSRSSLHDKALEAVRSEG